MGKIEIAFLLFTIWVTMAINRIIYYLQETQSI